MSDNETRKARPLGINHVVLEVDDLDKALEFYGALLEFTLARQKRPQRIYRPG